MMLKEFWFWAGVVGIVYAAFLGWTSHFAHKGKMRSRHNSKRRESTIAAITILEFAIVYVEMFWRISHGERCAVFELFTDEIFYEMIIYSVIFLVGYGMALCAAEQLAEVIHIGLFYVRKEQRKEQRIEQEEKWSAHKAAERAQTYNLARLIESNQHH